MQLILLGFVFAIGLFVYYLFSTSSSGSNNSEKDKVKKNASIDDDLKRDENVIFLPDDVEKIKKKRKKK
ncbi:hypothetical protein M2140_001300 [Clostridiales Family XIII bacterium PM5-7]